MNSPFLKKALPHILAVIVFAVVAVIYCKPALQGLEIAQPDAIQYKGMPQQSLNYKAEHGHFPLWVESAFSGMPGYTVAMEYPGKVSLGWLEKPLGLWLPAPISYFVIACICFYILTQVLRINSWIGVLSSLAYAYSSYDPIITVVGHVTKMQAIGFAPGVIAGLLLLYQSRRLQSRLWGAFLLTCFFYFQIGTAHVQVVYYTLISAGFLTLYYLLSSWREKKVKDVVIGMVIAGISMGIGYGMYAVGNLPMAEYAKETMRGGKTELTGSANTGKYISDKGGLSKEYAFDWSYGVGETMTLLVPDARGGGDLSKSFTGNSKFVDKLTEVGVPEDNALQMVNGYAYWGDQRSTAGPVYLGAVCWFLFIIGLIYVKGWPKWWLVSVTITGIVLAWGKNFATVNYFLFDYLPLYKNFRAPTIALVMPQFSVPLLGALGLNNLLASKESREENWKKFKKALIITGGLLVVAIGAYFSSSYKSPHDSSIQQQFVQMASRGQQNNQEAMAQANSLASSLMGNLRADRQSLFGSDLLRTILLIVLSAALIWLYIKGKYKQQLILLAGMLVLSSFDLLAVGRRYLTYDNFVDPSEIDSRFAPTPADQQISADPDKNFRVYDATSSDPFSDSRVSYYHNSIGGYSPAKLGLYQDIIEHQLGKGNMHVFNMLNTKYFIEENPTTRQPQAMLNPNAYGPCWLVRSIDYVKDGNDEMKALDSINTRDTVIIQEKYKPLVKFQPVEDSTAKIQLVSNLWDTVNYTFSAKTNQFAVFSEIYYDKGWSAYIDGNKADIIRVDYILRGLSIPAGDHHIQFRFEPATFYKAVAISTWCTVLAYIMLVIAAVPFIITTYKKWSKGKVTA
ncbi:MAG TPA: YfhO family protein [Puia sp.]|nr:YfhO family protein [Puia sp.]